MNILLIFFALPVATILLAIVLEKILKSPILVGITFFAIFLIVTFAAFDASFLVFAVAYALLAYITALITKFICKLIRRIEECGICDDDDEDEETTCNISEAVIAEIAEETANQTTRELLNAISGNNNNSSCGCNRRF